ncbi:TRAM domain-containing protein [Streptomyces caniscabiei]|uniref:class I SAM-dependent RNA methyltransferase n=1 Tax=Streptomyces caniscabiei TaxID=2746961 RepID=UPI0029A5D6DE|nr:TRAM domain-containing protein [Streptomyces caniscabiei]MDX2776074.1 TRAM domain-containing protein [Streptomyces caniscabiei]
MKQPVFKTLILDKIVGGGQTLGQLDYGKKAFVWGGLPGEKVEIQVTKKKSSFVEGIVTEVIEPSNERIEPTDPDSYLSTSPWQIMTFDAEQHYKAALVEEAFELHDIVVPEPIDIYSDGKQFEYRNKIEYSWWWDKERNQLDLAFFRRGTHGKIPIDSTSLAHPAITAVAHAIRDMLRARDIQAFHLKTVIIRCDQQGNVVAQLYVKDEMFDAFTEEELETLQITGFELIFSNPKSPASVITKRLQAWGQTTLTDTILGVPFTYAAEGFFQINIPVYEQALRDMRQWVPANKPAVDLYSGVGSIGLTIGGNNVTMVEINEHAVREMQRNITALEREKAAKAILAPSESALEHITGDATIIVDPPRAGLHEDVVNKLLDTAPERIVYLSCNPVTQARDVARLAEKYGIRAHRGYNFFPRTPHIEHLVVLDLKAS